jgi:hypothetical protein
MKPRAALLSALAGVSLLSMLAIAPRAARAKSEPSAKPHTWTVVLQHGRVQHCSSSPEDQSLTPVFRRGRGDQIQFLSRDDRYWVRFRTPTPLRLKGQPVQRFEVFPVGITPNPVYFFTTDSPADSVDWERFPFEIHGPQDMPRDTPDADRITGKGPRPETPPPAKKDKRKDLAVDLFIDGVR